MAGQILRRIGPPNFISAVRASNAAAIRGTAPIKACGKTEKRPFDSYLEVPCEMRLYNQCDRLQENVLMLQKLAICQD